MKKKILYIHGLSSSGSSATVQNLRRLLPECEIIAPDVPVNPIEALAMLRKMCKEQKPNIVVGTSMGGMFAQQMHGFVKILINPAFHVSEFIRQNLGIQTFFNPRQDGAEHYEITSQLCDDFEEVEKHQFEGITPYDRKHTYAFFGEYDILVNCQDEYEQYYDWLELFDGEHRVSLADLEKVFVPFIKEMLLTV